MKMNRKNKKNITGMRAHSELAEFLYQSIRSGMSRSNYLFGEVFAKRVRTHLNKRYRNEAEIEALLKLQGGLKLLTKIGRFTQTKGQARAFWHQAEQERYDKKRGLTKEDAATAFLLDRQPRKISALPRPTEMEAKPTTPYYARRGSSRGKVLTQMKGAVQTNKAFEDFVNSLIKLGSSTKDKVKVKRTITQSMKL